MKNGLIFKNMKNIYSLVGWVMIAAGMGALPAGCGTEVEFEEPDFEVAVNFDFNTVRFDWDGGDTEESQWPSFVPNFYPYYYKVVEKPEWVEVGYSYNSGWCEGSYVGPLHCGSNPSESPRSGIVKVVVSNVMKDEVISRDEPGGILEADLPVYRFESEFTVTQEGRPGGEQ